MYLALYLSALIGCACAQNSDVQYVKSVKGGGGGWQYNPAINYNRFYGHGYNMRQNMSQHGYNLSQNTNQHGYDINAHNATGSKNYEVGVCYIEVPTAQLARDPAHVPAGNGSRPDLSRIRTCCQGYIRNIHNFRICDPVCTQECVNALCTAPETCSCFPDHVKNLGGLCVPTCPIGCQNGHCSGGECLCEQGYTLNSESQFCIPSCKENCGGIGNCTAPNRCECKTGYESTAEGSCKPVCNQCINGECVAPNECRCRLGFIKSANGSCKLACDECKNGDCVGENICRCHAGYTNEHPGTCVPECALGCGPTSRCIAPNTCSLPITTTSTPSPVTHTSLIPNYPLHTDNQVRPNPSNPGYPGNQIQPHPSNPTYPSNQPQPDPNNPRYPGNQVHQNPSYPGYNGNNIQTNPTYPGYPGNQFGQNPSNSIYPSNQSQPDPNNPRYPGTRVHQNPSYPGYGGNNIQTNPAYPGYSEHQNQPNPSYPGYPDHEVQINTSYNESTLNEEICSQPCINGICVGVNTCRCKPGYYMDGNDPTGTRCLPRCAGGCINGVCSAPNFCICNMGYYKDTSVKGRPSCVKRIRRSVKQAYDKIEPINVAELLIFEIPDVDIDN